MNSDHSHLLPIAMGGTLEYGCVEGGCDYCCSTRHSQIAPGFAKPVVIGSAWDALQLGNNPAAVPGELDLFYKLLDLDAFAGPIAFTVRTDPRTKPLALHLRKFLESMRGRAMPVLISKIPQQKEADMNSFWTEFPNAAWLVGLTGLGPPFERIEVGQLLRTLELGINAGERMAANIVPAIAELVDYGDLGRRIKSTGCDIAILGGFKIDRNPLLMTLIKEALSPATLAMYMEADPNDAVLPPGAEEHLIAAGLTVVTQEEWLLSEWTAVRTDLGIPALTREAAQAQVERLLPYAFLYGPEAAEMAIQRRCS